jgi:hypothetical protein
LSNGSTSSSGTQKFHADSAAPDQDCCQAIDLMSSVSIIPDDASAHRPLRDALVFKGARILNLHLNTRRESLDMEVVGH